MNYEVLSEVIAHERKEAIACLWHPASEKPEKGKELLIRTIMGGYAIGSYTYPWDSVSKWMYIEELESK